MSLKCLLIWIMCWSVGVSFAQTEFAIFRPFLVYPEGTTSTPSLQVGLDGSTTLKSLRLNWNQANAYQAGDVILYINEKFYKATTYVPANTPFSPSQWQFAGGGGASIPSYTSTTRYFLNDIVLYQPSILNNALCQARMPSSNPAGAFKTISWTVIGNYIPSTLTVKGDVVLSNTLFDASHTQHLIKMEPNGQFFMPTNINENASGTVISETLTVRGSAIFKSIQTPWSQSNTYSKGDVVLYSNNKFYQAQTDIASNTTWDISKWISTGEGVPIFTSTLNYPKGTLVVYGTASNIAFYQALEDIPVGAFNSASWTVMAPKTFLDGISVQQTTTIQSLLATGTTQIAGNSLVNGNLDARKSFTVSGTSQFTATVTINNILNFSNATSSGFVPPTFISSYFNTSKPTTAGQIAFNKTKNSLMVAKDSSTWKELRYGKSVLDCSSIPYQGLQIVGMPDLQSSTLSSYQSTGIPGNYVVSMDLLPGAKDLYAVRPSTNYSNFIINFYANDGCTILFSSSGTISSVYPLNKTPTPLLLFDTYIINDANAITCTIDLRGCVAKLIYPQFQSSISLNDIATTGIKISVNDIAKTKLSTLGSSLPSFITSLASTTVVTLSVNSKEVYIPKQQAQNLYYAHKASFVDDMQRFHSCDLSFQGLAVQYGDKSGLTTTTSNKSPVIWLGYAGCGTSSDQNLLVDSGQSFSNVGTDGSLTSHSATEQVYVLSLPESHNYKTFQCSTSNSSYISNISIYALVEGITPVQWVKIGTGSSLSGKATIPLLPINSSTFIFHASAFVGTAASLLGVKLYY